MPEPTVVASSVIYRIGDAILVDDVDFEAVPGELIGVIGPNGAGKSTLLNLLAGSLQPSEGRVLLDGVDTTNAAPTELARLRAMLTQQTPLDLPYTAGQVVAMGRFPHRRDPANTSDRDHAVIATAMEQTDTTRFAARIYATLSAGERTLVSLARVLAQDTPIVLLDEPTTALDVAHQERIMRQAVLLAKERTVVVVLHDLNAAAAHSDRIVLMHQGSVVAHGQPKDVFKAELLSDVYDQPLVVLEHPFRDCPLVLPAPDPITRE